MKIVENNEVILGNQGETSKFKIAASAKAFKILSSGLYKNKIRAIVRELTCNVVDAHKLIDTKEPFTIKAPTALDPRFVIRDFGPGLDDESIVNLYSTYFASTKAESNDFIGALGLGSKSPFSYTDTFTVVSYNGGMVRGYTAMLDNGEPSLRKTFEEEMTAEDKNGIEITVPVKIPDISRWVSEIQYVLRTFTEWPHVVKGCQAPNYFPSEADKPTWFSVSSPYEQSGIYALYGNIVYPLKEVPGLNRSWMQVNNNVVMIRFPLGELDIAASREELSLDETTIKNIINRVDSISKVEMKETIDELNAITNERELLRKLNSFSGVAVNTILGTGEVITGTEWQDLREKYSPQKELAEFGSVYPISIDTRMGKIKKPGHYYHGRNGVSLDSLFSWTQSYVNILIDDKPSKRVKAIRALSYEGKHTSQNIVVYREDSDDDMAAFEIVKNLMGDDKINLYRVSELDVLIKKLPESSEPKEKRPASNNVHTYTLGKDGYYDVTHSRMTSEELKDLDGYVMIRRRDEFHTFPEDIVVPMFNESDINNVIAKLGIKEFHVVRSTVIDRLVKYNQCESLFELITEKLIELIDEVDYDQIIGNYHSRTLGAIERHDQLSCLKSKFTKSGKSTKASEKLNSVIGYVGFYAEKDTDQYRVVKILKDLRDMANEHMRDKIAEFENKFPAITYVLSNCYSFSDKMFSDIIQIVNNNAVYKTA